MFSNNNINKVDIMKNKILFLGYGAVAKCVWNYFDYYFIYDINNIYILDKCCQTIIGPKTEIINIKNILIEDINVYNFDNIIKKIGLANNDIIIDLTSSTSTYYFVKQCLIYGINYINTSIEDTNDIMFGTSIDFQQKEIINIFKDFSKRNKINCNILIEFGQNPGLIQHYVLYALNCLNKLNNGSNEDNYDMVELIKTIDRNKIGMILMSEIDDIYKKDKRIQLEKNKIYNTWSVSGLIMESVDKCELVYGKKNKYIKPSINKYLIDKYKTFKTECMENKDYQVLFLKEPGINCYLDSICPILDNNNNIKYSTFEGRLIHHGEIFELARLFGEKAPFMSYVYKINQYAEKTIKENLINLDCVENLKLFINNNCNNYHVINNFEEKYVGFDSIGCTIFCGISEIEKIYWCGSLLSDKDKNVNKNFTPTIIQVASGVLSGLSYIMETTNKNRGLMMACDLDTDYILKKSTPLLGKFFFTEINKKKFNGNFNVKIKKYL